MMTVVRLPRRRQAILGNPVGHKPTLARIGYLPENHRFPEYLTGRQVLEFFAASGKGRSPTRRRRASELLEVVGMTPWADAEISTYSKGMLQRVRDGPALVHDPDLVVLDEPTDGVIPSGPAMCWSVIGSLRGKGKTVFIDSHALSELESICDRVAILSRGRCPQGTLDALTIARQRYEIEIAAPPGGDALALRPHLLVAIDTPWPRQTAQSNRGMLNGTAPIEVDRLDSFGSGQPRRTGCAAADRRLRGAPATRFAGCSRSGHRSKICL